MHLRLLFGVLLCTLGMLPLCANTIALEGSDATAFHGDGIYTTQLFKYLGATAAKPVLVLGGVSLSPAVPSGIYQLAPGYSLASFTLSNYSAIYVESPGGCCLQADMAISAADKAAIGAAEALGLNLAIENYGGGPAWGPMLPAAVNALPASAFGGYTNFGTAGGPTCTDLEKFNALGLSKGFTQPPVLSCYEHQAYRLADFTALGLGFASLVDSDPAYFGMGPAGEPLGSAFLGTGALAPPPPGIPEPSSVLMLGSGLIGLGLLLRRRVKIDSNV